MDTTHRDPTQHDSASEYEKRFPHHADFDYAAYVHDHFGLTAARIQAVADVYDGLGGRWSGARAIFGQGALQLLDWDWPVEVVLAWICEDFNFDEIDFLDGFAFNIEQAIRAYPLYREDHFFWDNPDEWHDAFARPVERELLSYMCALAETPADMRDFLARDKAGEPNLLETLRFAYALRGD